MSEMDHTLESAIDGVGRSRVFDLAARYGWRSGDAVPKWVWWCLVNELRQPNSESTSDLKRTPEAA
jgi:hypothetical protein